MNPEIGRYGRPSPEKGEEQESSPPELSPEAEAAIAAIKKTVEGLSKE